MEAGFDLVPTNCYVMMLDNPKVLTNKQTKFRQRIGPVKLRFSKSKASPHHCRSFAFAAAKNPKFGLR
jgi:hypothetical protein